MAGKSEALAKAFESKAVEATKAIEGIAGVGKPETVALFKQNAVAAAVIVRGLSDEQLARSGNLLTGLPSMTTEQAITGILINHIDDHMSSIRATVGR